MKITFLGTSASVPTKDRNSQAILLTHLNENILIDCGEGTQRQLRLADISPTKITKILISHWHADHVLGIPGLLHTIFSLTENKTIEIYGPKNSKKYFQYMLASFNNEKKFRVILKEITKEGLFLKTNNLEFYSKKLYHSI